MRSRSGKEINPKKFLYGKILDKFGHLTNYKSAQSVQTVVIILGPYRNLTTFIAALTAMHPNCRVLNHAGDRVFNNSKINFLSNYSDVRFQAFKRFALYASKGGMKGKFGGDILRSHAFDDKELKEAAKKAAMFEKGTIKSILWKESNYITDYFLKNHISLDEIIAQNKQIKFLFPVRNPMACAVSNWKMKGIRQTHYHDCNNTTEVMERNLYYLRWFLEQSKNKPDSFYYFFEHEYDSELLRNLCSFFEVPFSEKWHDFAVNNMKTRNKYTFEQEYIQSFKTLVNQYFADYPAVKEQLLKFTENNTGQ